VPSWTPDFFFTLRVTAKSGVQPVATEYEFEHERRVGAVCRSQCRFHVAPRLRERLSLKLASAGGLSKLSPAISLSGTRRSIEDAAHCRSLIPLSAACSRADSTIRNAISYFESASGRHGMTHINSSSTPALCGFPSLST
jgi:hypothetical protein